MFPARRSGSDSAESDAHLIEGVRQGSARALEAIFRRYGRLLLDVTHGYLTRADEAEEVVQDLFLWIWEHRESWTVPSELRPYLLTAVRNRALNRLRHRRVEQRLAERMQQPADVHDSAARSPAADPLDTITGNELSAVVNGAIVELPPRCRDVFLLIRHDELTYREVAAILGISPKTVEIHMTRALGAIRAAVTRWRDGV